MSHTRHSPQRSAGQRRRVLARQLQSDAGEIDLRGQRGQPGLQRLEVGGPLGQLGLDLHDLAEVARLGQQGADPGDAGALRRQPAVEVDDLLDAIEAGELLGDGGDADAAPPEGALSTIFLAADRLAKDPMDAGARTDLIELSPHVDAKIPPYGMAHRPWAGAIDGVDVLVELINADAATGSPGDTAESDIIGAAQELRSLLRPYV